MDKLTNLYSNINADGISAIKNHHEQVDPYLSRKQKDDRRGLTLLAALPAHVSRNISFCLQELKGLAPAVYFYPSVDMHITIIDLLAARSNFSLPAETAAAYQRALQRVLAGQAPVEWHFAGFIVSPGAILATGYYSPSLAKLRTAIRTELPSQGLALDERYPTYSGHVTVARFAGPLADSDQLLRFIQQNRHTALGNFRITELNLVKHDWYNHYQELLGHYQLGWTWSSCCISSWFSAK